MQDQDQIPTEVLSDTEAGIVMADSAPTRPNRPRKVYAGMWGPLEVAAVSIGALSIIAASLIYFFLVLPSDGALAKNKSEASRLEAELISAKSKYGEITSTETQVVKLLGSVDDFQTRFLPVLATGQSALYQRLNGLIGAYGLVNTTGPDYAPLEANISSTGQQTDEERGRAKFRSLFPGVYVTVTVEGPYQNLRRFIRDIETGREFIVISSVELAPSDSEKQRDRPNPSANPASLNPVPGGPVGFNQPAVQNPAVQRQRGKTHGEVVSLHIEMAAYFRRPDFAPMVPFSGQ
ncbi:MAG: hypothetical protein ACKVQJ_14755 [Pyrinomonadaceae bacterium]